MIYIPTNKEEFVLPVPHYTQLNNTGGKGWRECFLTCATMLADYLTEGFLTQSAKRMGFREPEDVYASRLAEYGDTTDWNAQRKTLQTFGINGYNSNTASLEDVASALYLGVPVIAGTKYRTGGHIVLFVGRYRGGFVVLCPNGIRQGATNNWSQRFYSDADAMSDTYSWELLKRVFVDIGPEHGWAYFATSVNGVPTGVRNRM